MCIGIFTHIVTATVGITRQKKKCGTIYPVLLILVMKGFAVAVNMQMAIN